MALSVQKDRFRRLVSGAILELWKKETGSLASVFIEATVCITSCNNRRTVVQLSDHFPGLIPEPPPPAGVAEKTIPLRISNDVGMTCHVMGQKRKMTNDDGNNSAGVGKVEGYRGVLSHPSSSSSSSSSSVCHCQQRMDRNNNQTFSVAKDPGIDGDNGKETDKTDSYDETSEEEAAAAAAASEDAEKNHLRFPLPPLPPPPPPLGVLASGTFYRMTPDVGFQASRSRPATAENKNEKTPSKRSTEENVVDDSENLIPAQRSHLSAPVVHRRRRRDADPVLSAPQDYTDQALDAIRSRLLNGKAAVGGSTPPRPRGHVGSFDAAATAAAPAWSPIKRENPGPVVSASAAESGVLVRQRFPPPSASSPLQLFQLSRSLTGAAVSGPIAHPLQRPIVRIGGPESGLSASSGVTDPDEKEEEGTRSFGLRSGQFSGQKIERRFDGMSEDRSPGSDQKTYSCGFCRKAFLFKSKYQEHLPVHTSARPFECNLCARTYKYKYDLRVHLRSHLGIPTKSTTCPFCAEKFATNKLMRSHVKETHREPRQVDEEQGTTAPESASSVSV